MGYMKIALIGYGKMGKLVEQIAIAHGHVIVVKIDPKCQNKTISAESLIDSDVCIDFTHPSQALKNLELAAELGKNVVIGTTGWYEDLNKAEKIVNRHQIGCIYSPNFSLGIALFIKMLSMAATIIAPFDSYDVGGMEIHHNQKADAPSGTAQLIRDELQKLIPRKTNQIDFSSLRVGSVPGTHSIIFDSPVDTITLTHAARNREGFAIGAIHAAEWIIGKKGLFTLDDLLGDVYEKA